MRALYGHSLVRTRANHRIRTVKSKNVSVCCAISKNRKLNVKHQNTTFNSETFQEFIQEILGDLESENINMAAIIVTTYRFMNDF
ncbi:hypothetical protein H312_03304 [Anncaliia algerae PRA339]|uniref:Uncharacterized protein n=1 Tax=Anncaliia algerae PRA339 TaxID=1288291 RepID=A0A059EWQ6_9MICR|nr:hypothetical protein H312_03304 [Anncaliia algerae PRA339]